MKQFIIIIVLLISTQVLIPRSSPPQPMHHFVLWSWCNSCPGTYARVHQIEYNFSTGKLERNGIKIFMDLKDGSKKHKMAKQLRWSLDIQQRYDLTMYQIEIYTTNGICKTINVSYGNLYDDTFYVEIPKDCCSCSNSN